MTHSIYDLDPASQHIQVSGRGSNIPYIMLVIVLINSATRPEIM